MCKSKTLTTIQNYVIKNENPERKTKNEVYMIIENNKDELRGMKEIQTNKKLQLVTSSV
jgi:hypothetical protein